VNLHATALREPSGTLRAFGLKLDARLLRPLARSSSGARLQPAERVRALAEALAASPVWATLEHAIMVVRTEPPAGLAILGAFDDAATARLELLPQQLQHELPRLRYVGYARAEQDCERLASMLVDAFGRDELRSMRYFGIPRGGLIVLGMLSYALDLRREQLAADARTAAPLVVVDDCSLTGLRFRQFVEGRTGQDLVFAHLYSHPELRAAIMSGDPRVTAVLASNDLADHAPELLGDGYGAWLARWKARDSGSYWFGRPDKVCFAWSEPSFTFWNPVTHEEEEGWRLVPPSACLKNRIDSGAAAAAPVQFQPAGTGSLRPADATFYGELRDKVLIANIDGGHVVSLGGVAADMWRAVLAHGERTAAVHAVASAYDADAERVGRDLDGLIGELAHRGFIVHHQTGSDTSNA
jgi:hypothetical protein